MLFGTETQGSFPFKGRVLAGPEGPFNTKHYTRIKRHAGGVYFFSSNGAISRRTTS